MQSIPCIEVLPLPELQLVRWLRVHIVAKRGQPRDMRLPAEVQLRGEAAVVEREVDEIAPLRQQRQHKSCSIFRY